MGRGRTCQGLYRIITEKLMKTLGIPSLEVAWGRGGVEEQFRLKVPWLTLWEGGSTPALGCWVLSGGGARTEGHGLLAVAEKGCILRKVPRPLSCGGQSPQLQRALGKWFYSVSSLLLLGFLVPLCSRTSSCWPNAPLMAIVGDVGAPPAFTSKRFLPFQATFPCSPMPPAPGLFVLLYPRPPTAYKSVWLGSATGLK